MEAEVSRLDRAFEWVILFIGISYATIIQLLTWVFEVPTPPQTNGAGVLIMSVIRLTFVPLLIIILIWLGKFISAEPKKMFFRKLAWGWGMFQLATHILSTLLLVTLDMPRSTPEEAIYVQMIIFPSAIIVPAIVYVIYRRIISLYKKATVESMFWKNRWWNHGATATTILSLTLYVLYVAYLPHPYT